MRINKWLALHAKISRRQADEAISSGQVTINAQPARIGQTVGKQDRVMLSGQLIDHNISYAYILLNKPLGYVCSRSGQGKPTVYDLLPEKYHHLKIAGRLDHDSCGLLLMTDDGDMIFQLTHPKFGKQKVYNVTLDKPLSDQDLEALKKPIKLEDGSSELHVSPTAEPAKYIVTMSEGRNRQIRRTFKALGYQVTYLERTQLGPYKLNNLEPKQYQEIKLKSHN